MNRRKFLHSTLAVIFSMQLFYGLFDFLNPAKANGRKNKKQDWKPVGKVSDFENGKIYPFLEDKYFLYRADDGGFIALSVKCTHLGCALRLNDNQKGFICPCHSSKFSALGMVEQAPASRPLSVFPLRILDSRLEIDLMNAQRRNKEDKTILTYS